MLNLYNVKIVYKKGTYLGTNIQVVEENALAARNTALNDVCYWSDVAPEKLRACIIGTITECITEDI